MADRKLRAVWTEDCSEDMRLLHRIRKARNELENKAQEAAHEYLENLRLTDPVLYRELKKTN